MLKRFAATGMSWGFALLGVQAGYIDPNWPLVVGVFVAALILGIVAEMKAAQCTHERLVPSGMTGWLCMDCGQTVAAKEAQA